MITLEFKDLTKRFGRKKVFEGINFKSTSNSLSLVGSNGSGKSTLLKCLAYLYKPNSGKISWKMDEQEIALADFKQQIAVVAPYLNLYAELSIMENIHFHQNLKNKEVEIDEVHFFKELLSIEYPLEKPFSKLSSGQQQRAKLLSASIGKPEIIFLDEPTSNLDEKGNYSVEKLVEYFKQKNTFIVLATNESNEVSWCDNLISL